MLQLHTSFLEEMGAPARLSVAVTPVATLMRRINTAQFLCPRPLCFWRCSHPCGAAPEQPLLCSMCCRRLPGARVAGVAAGGGERRRPHRGPPVDAHLPRHLGYAVGEAIAAVREGPAGVLLNAELHTSWPARCVAVEFERQQAGAIVYVNRVLVSSRLSVATTHAIMSVTSFIKMSILLPCRTTWHGQSSRCFRSRTTSGRLHCDPMSSRQAFVLAPHVTHSASPASSSDHTCTVCCCSTDVHPRHAI